MCECAHACECLCEGKSIATGSGGKAPGPPDQGLGEDFSWVIRPDTNVSSQAKKRVGRVQQGGFTQALLRVDALMEPQREPGPGHSAEATCKPVAAAQGLGLHQLHCSVYMRLENRLNGVCNVHRKMG